LRLKTVMANAIEEFRKGDQTVLEKLISEEPGVLRYLLSMTYQDDVDKRTTGARGIAIGCRYHPRLVKDMVRRLIWAMNDESGTNALSAPAALRIIAEENSELLLPFVPDLTRLSTDPGLREGLTDTLKIIAEQCPGKVGQRLTRSLRKRLKKESSR